MNDTSNSTLGKILVQCDRHIYVQEREEKSYIRTYLSSYPVSILAIQSHSGMKTWVRWTYQVRILKNKTKDFSFHAELFLIVSFKFLWMSILQKRKTFKNIDDFFCHFKSPKKYLIYICKKNFFIYPKKYSCSPTRPLYLSDSPLIIMQS